MTRALTLLAVICGAFDPPQEPPAPKMQIVLNSKMFITSSDLWAEVREIDASFRALGAEVTRLAKGLDAEKLEDRNNASAAIRNLGLAAYTAVKEERDRIKSDQARWELDRILRELAGGWPRPSSGAPPPKLLTQAEREVLRAEVAKLVKGLEADAIDDRSRAANGLKSLGMAAFGAIKEERERTASEQARLELDSILKELAGPSLALPMGRSLGKAEGEDLRRRLTELKVRDFQHPFISLKDGAPATIFVGEEIPAGAGRRRVRLDADGKRVLLEEKRPAGMLKVGFQMHVKAKITGKDPRTVSLEIAITHNHIRRPIREMETPLGRVSDPEVIEIGVDLSPVLESGQHYLAGPFPAAEEKGTPWWVHVECHVIP